MTATTIPEEIVPSSLLAYTGDDFTEVVAAGMPNGDDYLQINKATGSNRQKAFQALRSDSHLIATGTRQTLAFWIRRRQSFSPTINFTQSTSGGTASTSTLSSILFGIGNGAGVNGVSTNFGWAIYPTSATTIAIGFLGGSVGQYWFQPTTITLVTNQWHFVVIDLPPVGLTSGDKTVYVYLDGNLHTTWIMQSAATWTFDPRMFANYANGVGRFAIGDPTNAKLATSGTGADGAVYDLGKLSMHSGQLTVLDQLALIDSMYYGG